MRALAVPPLRGKASTHHPFWGNLKPTQWDNISGVVPGVSSLLSVGYRGIKMALPETEQYTQFQQKHS